MDDLVPDETECPTCGESYVRPSRHWAAVGGCDWPAIPDPLRERLDGMALSGASADGANSTRLRVWTTAPSRARWLALELGWLAKGVETREQADKADQYVVKTISHPDLEEYRRWAGQNGVPPSRVGWSPALGRVWYTLAGGLQSIDQHRRQAVHIGARENDRRRQRFAEILAEADTSPATGEQAVILSQDDAAAVLRAIGPPTPGTAYKWLYDVDLRTEARERALADDPIVTVDDDLGAIYRALLSFVGERRDITNSDEWDRYIAAPAPGEIAEYLGGGSWGDALRVAGVHDPPDTHDGGSGGRVAEYASQITWEECEQALQNAADTIGEPLTMREYDDWREGTRADAPPAAYISANWGWADAVESAGLECGNRGPAIWSGEGGKISVDERDRALQAATEAMGEPLTSADYRQWRNETDTDAPHTSTIARRWGWADALEAAGLQPSQRMGRDLSDMLDAVERLREELGDWPTTDEYRDHKRPDDPAVAWLYDTEPGGVGSWPDLLDTAKERVDD